MMKTSDSPGVRRLPVAQIHAGECSLIGSNSGEPVWPLCEAGEWRSVEQLCQLFRSDVIELDQSQIRAFDRPLPPGSRHGGVAVYSGATNLDDLGLLYAHLTDRSFLGPCHTANDVVKRGADIFIILYHDLSLQFVERLSLLQQARAPVGILCASTPTSLRRQILLRAATLKLACQQAARVLEFKSEDSQADSSDSTTTRIVQGTRPALSRALLSAGHELVGIQSHSDGIDLYVAPNLTLCGMDHVQQDYPKGNEPSCLITGQCYRWPTPFNDVRQSSWFVSPETVRAGILILDTCCGFLAPGTAVNNYWGYLRHFLDRSVIGGIATTWKITLPVPELFDDLMSSIKMGNPLGEALRRHNQDGRSRTFAHAFCLFGDPQIQFKRARIRKRKQTAKRVTLTQQKNIQGASAFLRQCILQPRIPVRPSEAAAANAALRALDWLERLASQAHVDPDVKVVRAIEETRNLAMTFLLQRNHYYLTSYWMNHARDYRRIAEADACPSCGTPVEAITAVPAFLYARRRQVTICPQCGIIADASLGSQLSLNMKESKILTLNGIPPGDNWLGFVQISPRSDRQISILKWPRETDGRAVPSVVIRERIPNESCYITGFFFQGLDLACLSVYVHGGQHVLDRPQGSSPARDPPTSFAR